MTCPILLLRTHTRPLTVVSANPDVGEGGWVRDQGPREWTRALGTTWRSAGLLVFVFGRTRVHMPALCEEAQVKTAVGQFPDPIYERVPIYGVYLGPRLLRASQFGLRTRRERRRSRGEGLRGSRGVEGFSTLVFPFRRGCTASRASAAAPAATTAVTTTTSRSTRPRTGRFLELLMRSGRRNPPLPSKGRGCLGAAWGAGAGGCLAPLAREAGRRGR